MFGFQTRSQKVIANSRMFAAQLLIVSSVTDIFPHNNVNWFPSLTIDYDVSKNLKFQVSSTTVNNELKRELDRVF